MKTSRFGENITYLKNNKSINNIVKFVKANKFSDFSSEGITSYLSFRHPIGTHTMFDGIKKLDFGSEMLNNKLNSFWYPDFTTTSDSFEQALEKVNLLLVKSIKNIIKNKKKIAVTLSGGIDSSLIVGVLRKEFPKMDIYTYSAGFYGDDEFEYSRLVALENNTIHTEKVLNKEDYIGENSLLSSLIEFKGAPLHPNELALAVIEKMAKEDGCDIVLCGEGSDDIFGGYGQNFRMYMNYNHKEPFFKYFLENYRYFTLEDRDIIKDKYLVDDFQLTINAIDTTKLDADMRYWSFYFIQKLHTPGLITRGANAMRFNGYELAFPYIDEELVNYANSLPFEFKLKWNSTEDQRKAQDTYFRDISENYDTPKYILKKVAEKYINHGIIYRPKKGFPVPFEKWLSDLKTWDFDNEYFKHNDISKFSGWKKFMLINLDTFIKIFKKYKKEQ